MAGGDGRLRGLGKEMLEQTKPNSFLSEVCQRDRDLGKAFNRFFISKMDRTALVPTSSWTQEYQAVSQKAQMLLSLNGYNTQVSNSGHVQLGTEGSENLIHLL